MTLSNGDLEYLLASAGVDLYPADHYETDPDGLDPALPVEFCREDAVVCRDDPRR